MATELGTAYFNIAPNASGIQGKMLNALGGEPEKAGKEAGNNLSKTLISTATKVFAAAKIGETIKNSLFEGGALQQSIGGIETLYKDSAETMFKYADEAYRTTGLSANAYMENVTGFTASLLQGLKGDTDKAAEISNMAMIDMSDNANKMGTSMESIQVAYQGFAKQNYTMLDNLKLGYGGTKTEMQRLLKDAQKISGVKYDISNLSDVYEAIHVIQQDLGITGTTAKEAASTFTGSLSAMKAAATNVLGKLSLGQDIGPSLEALGQTVSTFLLSNLVPMIGNIVKGIPTLVMGSIGSAKTVILDAMNGMLSALSNGVLGGSNNFLLAFQVLVLKAGQTIEKAIPEFASKALPMLLEFANNLKANVGLIVDGGISVITSIVQGIINAMPQLITYVPQIITTVANIINENLPKLLMAGLNIITMLVKGIWDNRGVILTNIGNIFNAVIAVISAINWFNIGSGIINFITNGVNSLFNSLPTIISNIGNTAKNFLTNIDWAGAGRSLINFIVNGISSIAGQIPNALKNIGNNAMNAFKSIDWISLGSNVVNGIVRGITNGASAIVDAARNLASNAFEAAKNKLGINSPSKVFEWLGDMSVAGFVNSFIHGRSAISEAVSDAINLPNVSGSMRLNGSGQLGYGKNGFIQNITINSPTQLSPSEVARQTRNSTRQLALRLNGVM